jgi:uncharacterized protein YqeY
MLKQQIQDELKSAMLARDTLKTSVLRMLKSAVSYYEINKGGAGYEATDEDVLVVINKEAKQRRDSIDQFTIANRQELVDKENKELEILQVYLPVQMEEKEIIILVDEAIKESGASTLKDIGKVMGILMPKTKGKASGDLVSKLVREKLG